jgi:hypothetical protein
MAINSSSLSVDFSAVQSYTRTRAWHARARARVHSTTDPSRVGEMLKLQRLFSVSIRLASIVQAQKISTIPEKRHRRKRRHASDSPSDVGVFCLREGIVLWYTRVHAPTRAWVVRQRRDVRAGNRTTSLSKSGVTCILTSFVIYARTRRCAHARYRYRVRTYRLPKRSMPVLRRDHPQSDQFALVRAVSNTAKLGLA